MENYMCYNLFNIVLLSDIHQSYILKQTVK
jgi:hypothetical protein